MAPRQGAAVAVVAAAAGHWELKEEEDEEGQRVLDPDVDITRDDLHQLEAARDARAVAARPLTSQAMAPSSVEQRPVVAIVGAGAIGCFLGALLHRAGVEVRFLLRQSARSAVLLRTLAREGLVAGCSTDAAFKQEIAPGDVPTVFGTDAARALHGCSCVLVATKRTANVQVQQQLAPHVGKSCPVAFLQNGLSIRRDLAEPVAFEAIESVVNFNVTQDFERGTVTLTQSLEEAHLILDGAQPSARRLAALLGRTPLRTGVSDAFEAVQRGKLLLNMTNAVNALSGQAIGPMFFDPAYRRVLAASMSEATAVFEADGLAPQAAARRDAFLLRWLTTLLLSPQWFFAATMGRRLKGRGDGFTSMAQDMQARRVPTEIDFLNGAILQLGEALGVPTPVNAKLVALVKAAEQANEGCPGISGADLLQHTGLATISPSPLWRLVRMAMAGLIAARALKAAHSLRSSL